MKKLLLCFLVISLFFLAGCNRDRKLGETAAEEGAAKAVYVQTSPAEAGDFARFLSLPGNLQPVDQAYITAKVSGTVQKVYVDIGARVARGQILAKIDDTTYDLQYRKAVSSLAAEEVRYGDAEKNYERMKTLHEAQAVSRADFENVESQFKQAAENLNRARHDYELAGLNLKETNIVSPLPGIVSLKEVSEGENTGPGKPIFAVVNTGRMFVETGVAEKDIVDVKEGQTATIKVASLKDSSFVGQVTHIGPVPDNLTKTYPVKITVDNRGNLLKAGMFATVDILLDERKASLSVPREAVITEDGLRFVFVERDGKVEKRLIETGYTSDTRWEIVAGLESGEMVVSVGHGGLTDGSLVEVRQ